MGRHRRPNSPGTIFHITSRTQGGEPWFTPPVRDRIVDYVAGALGRSDMRLMAFAIMSNHLHLIVRQGSQPLDWDLQPILLRTALLVQRTHGLKGHVFQERFSHSACGDPDYARDGIVYTHLNPVRAGIVEDAAQYPWTSHALYAGLAEVPAPLARVMLIHEALQLFASRTRLDRRGLADCYAEYVAWRRRRDALRRAARKSGGLPVRLPDPPPLYAGNDAWGREFAPLFRLSGKDLGPTTARRTRVDMGAIAKQVLAEFAADFSLDLVRSTFKGREVVAVRRTLIRRLSGAGYSGAAIARYLRVSDQCVSDAVRCRRDSN